MGIVAERATTPRPVERTAGIDFGRLLELAAVLQFFLALLPRTCHRALTWLLGRRADEARGGLVLALSAAGLALGLVGFAILFNVILAFLAVWAHVFPRLVEGLAARGIIAPDSGWLNLVPAPAMV